MTDSPIVRISVGIRGVTAFALIAGMLLHAPRTLAQMPSSSEEGTLFENVVNVLRESYFDEDFRRYRLPDLVERYRPLAAEAVTLQQQREITQALLSNLPASHLGLLSNASADRLMGELQNVRRPSFGFELIEYDGKHFAHNVLEGGPAERAGLRIGDCVLAVDGTPVGMSERLDWRTDDAYLPDPPVRALLCEANDEIELTVEPSWGDVRTIEVAALEYSAYDAARASVEVIEHDGHRIGYVHFWLIHITGVASLVAESLSGELADCEALILDLRGRGGSGGAVEGLIRALQGEGSQWRGPVVALINHHSRSAKEVIASELRSRRVARLVGERTAGAVIPASFADVGHDTQLMYPRFQLGRHTKELEGIGVAPDVFVEDIRPYGGGHDPVRAAGVREAIRMAFVWTPEDAPALAGARTVYDADAEPTPVQGIKVEEILARMVEALGGEATLRGLNAQTLTGTIDVAGMLQGEITMYAAAPDLSRSEIRFESMGNFLSGHNGAIAWRDDPQGGAAVLQGEDRENMLEESDFYANLNVADRFEEIVLTGAVEFDEQPCYELKLISDDGAPQYMYIDLSTYLPMGQRSMQPSPMGGEAEVVAAHREYRNVDGVMVPMRIFQKVGDIQEMTIDFTEVSFEPISKDVFDLPESIQALLDSQ